MARRVTAGSRVSFGPAAAKMKLGVGARPRLAGTTSLGVPRLRKWEAIAHGNIVDIQSAGRAIVSTAIPSKYDEIMLLGSGLSHDSGTTQNISVEFSEDGGSTWVAATLITTAGSASISLLYNVTVENVQSVDVLVPKVVKTHRHVTNTLVAGANNFRASANSFNAVSIVVSGGNLDGGVYYLLGR